MAEAVSGAEAEDEEELAQWMPECDDCDNPAEHYCTTCGDKLCPGCKDHHLSRKKNRDHQVVPYSAGMRAAQTSKTTCSNHPGERYQLYCKPCRSPVCTPCIAQSHSGHDFISIPDALSAAKEKAITNLEILTKTIRPRVQEDCEKVKKSEAEAIQTKDITEKAMESSAKELHDMVDLILKENRNHLTEMMERNSMPILRKQKEDTDTAHRSVEKAIKNYDDNLRSSDPIDLLIFMKERESDDLESQFPTTVMDEVPLPRFQTVAKSRETIQRLFGKIEIDSLSEMPAKSTETSMPVSRKQHDSQNTAWNTTQTIRNEGKVPSLGVMKQPEKVKEFTVSKDHFNLLGKLRHHKPDKMWISASGGWNKVVLVDKDGKVIRVVDVKNMMYDYSGMYCTDDGELIYCDRDGKSVKKISNNFRITTLFNTGDSRPRGIGQLQSGDWVVCIADVGVLRVYNVAGKVVREVGKGHLQRPNYVTVNRANDDICVSHNVSQVIVFSSSGEKRLTYTGHGNTGTVFNPYDLCCNQLGNILITDWQHRVHIIDRDGHFLQYLVSGTENISYPITIDIDDRGYAWVGEYNTRKVKAYKYLYAS